MAIKVHLSRILGEQKMKMAELSRATGISKNALLNLYHERTTAIEFANLARICAALKIQVGDLLEYVPDAEQEPKQPEKE
jgi:putative transcriptional regulator